jgi:hypothetical protein
MLSDCTFRKATHLTTNQYVSMSCNVSALTIELTPDIIGCVSPLKYHKQHLIPSIRLGTIFYISYLAFEFPQNLALQRLRVGKWMRHVVHTFLGALHLLTLTRL